MWLLNVQNARDLKPVLLSLSQNKFLYSCKISSSLVSLFYYVFDVRIIFFRTPTISFLNVFARAQTKSKRPDIFGLAISSLHRPVV
jgi:hypothetical protein